MADLKTTNIFGDAYINNKVGIATNAPATRLQIGQLSPTAATEGIQFGDDTSARLHRINTGHIRSTGGFSSATFVIADNYLQTNNNLIYPAGFSSTQRLEVGNAAQNAWIDGITIAPGGVVTVAGNISAANLSGTNTGDQTIGNGTITIAAGTGIGVGTTNTFTMNQSGNTTVTVTNSGVTSAVAGTGVSVSGATGAVTFSIGQAVGTGNSPTFTDLFTTGNIRLRNTDPTITFSDTNHTSSFIHVNANTFFVLCGPPNAAFGEWAIAANGRWPLEINLTNNNATFGGNIDTLGLIVAGGNATIYRDLIVNGGASNPYGNRIIVGGTATTYTLQDATLRPTVYLNGDYPVLTLNHVTTNNALHGPTLQFAFNGLTTGGTTSRQIVIGAPGTGAWLDFGFSGGAFGDNTSYNPHNGIGGYNGITAMRLFSNGLLVGSTGAYPNAITSISNALDVRGTGYFSSSLTASVFTGAGTGLTGTAANLTAGSVTNGVYTTGDQTVAGNKTFSGITTFSNASDYQISLNGSGTTWAGIQWVDSNGTEYLWYNGQNKTFALGGGGSNVSGKKLHVDGGVTIGADYDSTTVLANGLNVQGPVQIGDYTTIPINTLSSAGTQSRTFEIARLGIDYNDWNAVGTFEVELHEQYYARGLKKVYNIWYGYVSNSGIRLVEWRGSGENNFQCRIGSQVQISGDSYYLPVYIDVRNYGIVDVVIKTNRTITTNVNPPIGSTYINTAPTATNISDFTADSDLEISTLGTAKLGGNVILTSASTSSLNIGGNAATATIANSLNASNNYTVTALTATSEVGTRGSNIGVNLERGDSTIATLRFDSDNFRIWGGGTSGIGEILRISETGNVGIGTTVPSGKLDVYNGSGRYLNYGTTGLLKVQRNVAALDGATPVLHLINTQGMESSTGLGTGIQIDLGYGGFTTDTVGTAARGARISAVNDTLYTSTAATQNASLTFYTSTAGTLTEKMRITSGGNVGIGTSIVSALLQVNSTTAGATLLRTDGTNGTLFSVVDDLSDSLMSVNNSAGLPVLEVFADDRIVMGQYGQNDLVVRNNYVGIGTNNPSAKLHVAGDIFCSGSISGSFSGILSFLEVDINSPVASSGTFNTDNSTDCWGNPKFKTAFNRYRWADAVAWSEYTVPSGYDTCFISHLEWDSGGYIDCYGVQAADGGLVFLRRINTRQSVENSDEGNGCQHDGETVACVGTGLSAFSKIRLHVKLGRFHMTGLAWQKSKNLNFDGTGMVHPAQISYQGAGSGLNADLLDGYNSDTANTANTIVLRDASGNFSAGTITATLSGTATNSTQLGGVAAASYVTLNGTQSLTNKTITGTITTASYANALNAANNYSVNSLTEGGYLAYPLREYVINLSAQSTSNFYPIAIDSPPGTDGTWHHSFSIDEINQGGAAAYNIHSMYGEVRGQGWTDQPYFHRIFHNFYDNNEKSLLGIWRPTTSWYGVVVYVRGGKNYYVRTTSRSVIGYNSATTLGGSVYAIKNSSGVDVSGTSANISETLNLINNPAGFYHSDNAYIGTSQVLNLSTTSAPNLSIGGSAGSLSNMNISQFTNNSGYLTSVTNISGNAATATILQTAKNIGGVSFNGSADIDLPGVNIAGNQNTSGTAAIATTANGLNSSNTYTVNNLTVSTATQLVGVKETYVNVNIVSNVVTIDLNAGTVFRLNYNGVVNSFTLNNVTANKVNSFTLISAAAAGAGGINFTFTDNTLKWAGTAPTATTTANKYDVFSFIYDGTNWYGFTGGLNY